MIPSIFISSTIADLHHLREALKEAVEEMTYRPVLSEFGGIGFLPHSSAEDSCYLAMRDCQIAVLIVGKRYGSPSVNDRSITYNEFLTAREHKIPVISLVEKEVLSYKKVFDANENRKARQTFPDMDQPNNTFAFIKEIMDAPVNNGILPFDSVVEARELLKTQLAHIFGDLLRSKFDPVKTEIKDVLSEVMTLRQELKDKEMDPQPFLRATRFLLDDSHKQLRDFVESINGSLEVAVPLLLKCKTFEEYLGETETEIKISETQIKISQLRDNNELVTFHQFSLPPGGLLPQGFSKRNAFWAILRGNRARMNAHAKWFFDYIYEDLRKTAGV